MESTPLFKGTLSILEKALDFRSRRHEAAVSNIANMDTPGYKAFDVVMDEAFQRGGETGAVPTLSRTHSGHFSGDGAGSSQNLTRTVKQPAVVAKADGNTVDLDRSMADLAENNLMYNTLAQMVSKKFSFLRSAIQGGSQ
ncbi:MAG: flagellar basal body rod protein FlgB [Desulfobacterales bacterium]|nr:flagellar basal body rod protein FlgB [Desulfobacterales bacterium]